MYTTLKRFSNKTPTLPHAFPTNMILQAYDIMPLQNQMRFFRVSEAIDGFL